MQLIILGAGGHGRVVADLATQIGKYNKISFLDDNSIDEQVIGKCEDFKKFKSSDIEMYPAFGNNRVRIEWEVRIESYGIKLAKIIHPLAYISPTAKISDGCIIMPYSIINTNVEIKKACIINIGAIIDHDCVLEEGCHIAPGAIVKGENYLPKETKVDSGEIIALQSYKKGEGDGK